MGGGKNAIKPLFFVSKSPFWFVRTYLCLYLFSPVINAFLETITLKRRIYLLLILGFMAVYMGSIGVDPAIRDGKNILYFLFVYVVGNTLRIYGYLWRRVPTRFFVEAFLLLNVVLVAGACLFDGTLIQKAIHRLSFPYNSPIMQVNALLFFLIIAKQSFKSSSVNWLASSALAIYLIHESSLVENYFLSPVSLQIRALVGNDYLTFFAIVALAGAVCLACILIDKLLGPIWKIAARAGEWTEYKVRQAWMEWRLPS